VILKLDAFSVNLRIVFGCSGFAADINSFNPKRFCRTQIVNVEQPADDRLEVLLVDRRFVFRPEFLVNFLAFDFLDHMRRVIIAAVRNGCHHVRELDRGH
jgi:hypothetical protein